MARALRIEYPGAGLSERNRKLAKLAATGAKRGESNEEERRVAQLPRDFARNFLLVRYHFTTKFNPYFLVILSD